MAIKFETNVPLLLHFPFGDFKDAEGGQYGPQFQYSVKLNDNNGEKNAIYASEALHGRLQCAQPLKGKSLWITKKEGEANRKYWEVLFEDGTPVPDVAVAPAQASAPASAPAARPAAGASGGSGGSAAAAAPVTIDSLEALMAKCITASARAWTASGLQHTSDNVQGSANTLFISAKDAGLARSGPAFTPPPPAGAAAGPPNRPPQAPAAGPTYPGSKPAAGGAPAGGYPPPGDEDLPF